MWKEYDPEYEQIVIGAMLLNNECIDSLEMREEDFLTPKAREAYRAIRVLWDQGKPADIITIGEEADKEIIGPSWICHSTSLIPTDRNAHVYANIVKENARYHRLDKLKHHIPEWIRDCTTDEVMEKIELYMLDLQKNEIGKVVAAGKLLPEFMARVEKAYKNKGILNGISTGYKELDDVIGGLRGGEEIIIAARPKIGKTSFCLNLAINILSLGVKVGFFSCEMSKESLIERIMGNLTSINTQAFRKGELTVGDFKRIMDHAGAFNEDILFIDDTPNIPIHKLKARARQMYRLGCRVLFIDYLTLISHPDRKMPRFERVGEISKWLKQLARELNIPVIVISQLNRLAEGKKPTLDCIRQSGEVEEDCDVVLFLHRERDSQDVSVIVGANRNGPIGEVSLSFDSGCAKYSPRVYLKA